MHVSNVNTYVSYHQGQDLSLVVKGSPCPGFQSPNLFKKEKNVGVNNLCGKGFFFAPISANIFAHRILVEEHALLQTFGRKFLVFFVCAMTGKGAVRIHVIFVCL